MANSPLVKTSWNGGDPNWGRINDALGYSSATVVEEKVDLGCCAPASRTMLWSLKHSQPTKATFKQLCLAVAPNEFDLHIKLKLGKTNAVMYAADLPEGWTANVSLAGKDHKTQFITASTGLYSIRMLNRGANAAK